MQTFADESVQRSMPDVIQSCSRANIEIEPILQRANAIELCEICQY